MQPLLAPPRDGLTETDVLSLLRDAPHVDYTRGLETLDLRMNVTGDISDSFLAGTISRNSQATIHGTCDLTLDGTVVIGPAMLLRPYMTLTAGGVVARFNCGVYVPNAPEIDFGDEIPTQRVTGQDRLAQLNRPFGDAFTTHPGEAYLVEVSNVMITAGLLPTDFRIDATAIGVVIPTPITWPLLADPNATSQVPVDAIADDTGATTYLRAVNTLLAAVNYRALWADWDGFLHADPYIDPASRAPEFTFDFDDELRAILARQRSRTQDLSRVPNKWIFIQQNLTSGGTPVLPVEGAGQYTVQNFTDGPTSIEARGGAPIGELVSVVQLDAADQVTLEALGDKQVAADRSQAVTFAWSSSPFPAAWHEDVYLYDDVEAGASSMKVASLGWTLDVGNSTSPPADMQHTLVQVA